MNDYQFEARKTAIYPDVGRNVYYPTLGLAGEAGEVAGKVKKIQRDDGGIVTDERRAALGKELGDVLWYVAQVATELGLTMDGIAQGNLDRLKSRQDRGVLTGDGDNR